MASKLNVGFLTLSGLVLLIWPPSREWLNLTVRLISAFEGTRPGPSVFVDRPIPGGARLQQTLAKICDGTIPGVVILPAGALYEAVTVPSNCTIKGAGPSKSVLKAFRAQQRPVISIANVQGVRLEQIGCDGSEAARNLLVDCIQITNSVDVTLSDVRCVDAPVTCTEILDGSRNITIEHSEFARSGFALPSVSGGGLNINPQTRPIKAIHISHSTFHDNNQGASIFNGSALAEDIAFDSDSFYANANDGLQVNSAMSEGSFIRGILIENSESFCNGWPANGKGFSKNCRPGLLQKGAASSSAGVGLDFIGSLIQEPIITGNRVHDNYFDGISTDGRTSSEVEVLGRSVSWISGTVFSPSWKPNQPVAIDGETYLISSVQNKKALTLSTSAGEKSAHFSGPSVMRAVLSRNQSYWNGAVDVGAGFWNEFADGNRYNSNEARFNNLAGYGCDNSSFLTFNGDKATSNNRSGRMEHGFYAHACLGNSYVSISANDPQAHPTQQIGIYLDSQTHDAFISTHAAFGPNSFIKDLGIGTHTASSR